MFTSSMFNNEPTTVKNPADWLLDAFGGGQTNAGMIVTPDNAMQVGAVQACVTLIAESKAQMPCHLYRRTKKGKREGRERATDHYLYNIVHDQPNGWQTAFEYYEQGQGILGLRGNHIALIERNNREEIEALIPINPDKVILKKGADLLPYYHLQDYNETVPMRYIHHVRGYAPDGYVGQSPIQTNKDVIGLSMAMEKHASMVFSNGTTLSGVIERPKESGQIETKAGVTKLLSQFKDRYSGINNMFNVALLQEGMSYKQMAMTNEDAQLLASRGAGVNEICRLYKVPPDFVQNGNDAADNKAEQRAIQLVIYCLMPWIKRWEQSMTRDLLLPGERGEYYIEHDLSGILRGDQKSRYEAYALGRQWGWLSVNDIRRLENLPPVKGGDTYLQPLNMIDASTGKTINNQLEKMQSEIKAMLT